MKNLFVNVSKETRMVNLPKQFIAVDGENLQSKLVFTFIDEFVNGQGRLEYEIKGEKSYVVLNKENDTYEIPVKNIMTKEGQIDMQLVITEGTDEEEVPVFKSNMFYLFCNSSINAVDEAPDGYELWIEQANAKLNQVDNLDIDIEDGIVTITKKDGTTKTENVKGDKGEKGDPGSIKFIIVNELPTEDIDDSAIYMKRLETEDAENMYEEYIYTDKGWELLGSANVQVDLEDYVTFNDYPTSSKAGVVRSTSSFGTYIANNGAIQTIKATNEDIDAKTNNYKPIVPSNLDYAVKSVGDNYYTTLNEVNTAIETALAEQGGVNLDTVIKDTDILFIDAPFSSTSTSQQYFEYTETMERVFGEGKYPIIICRYNNYKFRTFMLDANYSYGGIYKNIDNFYNDGSKYVEFELFLDKNIGTLKHRVGTGTSKYVARTSNPKFDITNDNDVTQKWYVDSAISTAIGSALEGSY